MTDWFEVECQSASVAGGRLLPDRPMLSRIYNGTCDRRMSQPGVEPASTPGFLFAPRRWDKSFQMSPNRLVHRISQGRYAEFEVAQ